MALPAIGDGQQIGDGNANETLNVGRSGQPVQLQPLSTGEIGVFGTTPDGQSTAATSVSTSVAIAVSSGYGFSTQAQADAIVAGVNACIAALKKNGWMASS